MEESTNYSVWLHDGLGSKSDKQDRQASDTWRREGPVWNNEHHVRTCKQDDIRMSSVYRIPSRRLKAFGAGARWLTCIASILLVTTSMPESGDASAQPSPTEAMRTTVNQALGVLRDQELKKPERTDERGTQLKRIAGSRFDYGEMAKRSL